MNYWRLNEQTLTKKLFGNGTITFASVIIILSNPTITMLFRFTRMYSLSMLLCLWMVYFAYRALTEKNHINDSTENKLLLFIKNNFDFHVGYVFGTLILLYFCSVVHINSLALCLGILFFVFYKAFASKDKKYIIAAFLVFLTIVLLILGAFFDEGIKKIPILGQGIIAIASQGGWFTNIHTEYLQFILNEFGSIWLALLCVALYLWCTVRILYKKTNKEIFDVLIYLGSITFSTVLFFVFFTDRYYSAKYIIMLTPISAIVYAVGLAFAYQRKKAWGVVISIIFCICSLLYAGRNYDENYSVTEFSNFLPAYETISEYYDLETDTVPIAGIYPREYYCCRVVEHYVLGDLRTGTSMDSLIKFAEEYPEGIITCEKGKFYHLTQGADLLLLKWSDRLSGEGIDSYNVEVSHYCFINGQQMLSTSESKIDKYRVYLNDKEQSINIFVDLKSFLNSAEILCVKINMESSDGIKASRVLQLILPENKDGIYQYELPWDSLKEYNPVNIEIESNYAVYADGLLQEYEE